MNINVFKLRNIKSTLIRLNLCNSFEKRFIESISTDERIMKREIGHSRCYSGFKEEIEITNKQSNIFLNLKIRFEKLDIFDRYTDYFELQKISLDDYDKGYFETFKGEFKESDGFKRWLKEKHYEQVWGQLR